MEWVLGDGLSTSFWYDRWLPNNKTMRQLIQGPLQNKEEDLTVGIVMPQYKEKGEWDITFELTNEIIHLLNCTYSNKNVKDKAVWGPSSKGVLTTSSVYRFLSRGSPQEWQPPDRGFKLNIDGSSLGNIGKGGVFRCKQGKWIIGYMSNIYTTNPIKAELTSLLQGLHIADDCRMIVRISLPCLCRITLLTHTCFLNARGYWRSWGTPKSSTTLEKQTKWWMH
ncbi:hypothetical protein KY289_015988 [Solanum tuberosum]|nr:hypothetical protein KY289_015988 [Solanum tuberosum]